MSNFACLSIKPLNFDNDKNIADKTVRKFHKLYNEKRFDEIYNLFTYDHRSQFPKEKFVQSLRNLYKNVGKITKTDQIKTEVKVQASFRKVHMFYKTKFEKKVIFEEFDCFVNDNSAEINFYGQPKNTSQ